MLKPVISKPIGSLIRSLSSDDGAIRQNARAALTTLGNSAVDPLIDSLESENGQARWEASKALGDIGGKDAVRALVKELDDNNRDVRWIATAGLMRSGDQVMEPLLHELIVKSGSVWVREAGIRIIDSLIDEGNREYLRPVLSALKSGAPIFEVPLAAYEALLESRRGLDIGSRGRMGVR